MKIHKSLMNFLVLVFLCFIFLMNSNINRNNGNNNKILSLQTPSRTNGATLIRQIILAISSKSQEIPPHALFMSSIPSTIATSTSTIWSPLKSTSVRLTRPSQILRFKTSLPPIQLLQHSSISTPISTISSSSTSATFGTK